MTILRVALDVPLNRYFDYLVADGETVSESEVGRRVRVPFGRRSRIGVIAGISEYSELPLAQLRAAEAILRDLPPLPADWFRLCEFCASYYQTSVGEVMLSTLPAGLRRLDPAKARAPRAVKKPPAAETPPPLTAGQEAVLAAIVDPAGAAGKASGAGFAAYLLHGITGSGKTEVYLRLIERALAAGRQALLLVPEINLTPQLEARVARRFPEAGLVSLHSELGEAARTRNFRAALAGEARIVLGTRLAVFTPLPDLGLIVVDEEHDASFKQQDGLRYSARDVAVFRARERGVPIVLGSATPSLESWANAVEPHAGARYTLLTLAERAVSGAALPPVRCIDTRREKLKDGLSSALLSAIEARLARGEQSLVFINRRGYAPVLCCASCGWVARCTRCTANLVLHQSDRRVRCHHCGFEGHVPRACPSCGNQDILPFGRGTQRIEEVLGEHFPAARILRVDRDSARSRKQWEVLAARIHAGEADILVGTQMLAKGHDFPKLTLVGAIGADAALMAADWRAPERLFAQLMQVAGRAGRAVLPGEVLIQTEQPQHPLYQTLARHDYPAFAAMQLAERAQAGFPPYAYQAMLRAEAPNMDEALAFLAKARAWPEAAAHAAVMLYDPVPMRLARRANFERAQLLVESPSRRALQSFLAPWHDAIRNERPGKRLRWHLEVDPIEF
ncbi:primosomal protein N' [Rhodocyclus tenuis]|uniref:Replication restart protein PriA n=1 Tax=Rhodocyclus gracilis TaxID=2929842 RepID=A0ABX0WHS2_9RHOO|nr:primosomal protein N' [Rhodocyclus gracilis]NJA88372.1 primosomal protein N' [Rhodocyclus gracilis]